jgi:CheY-like chemotaxis protein
VGDPLRLEQILLNLVGNAIKFSHGGRVTVRARLLDRTASSVLLQLEVEDQGIGLTQEQQDGLFAPYTQANNSTSRKYGGTGLGLNIVSRLAKLMGGEAGVSSAQGAGSRFWLTVPMGLGTSADLAQPDPGAAQTAAMPLELALAQRAGGLRVLLAEDDAMNQDVARELLADTGIQLDIVGNGQLALERVRDGDYALVLMDVQMPVMDGLDATRAIRLLPGRGALPVIAMTANAFQEDRQRCLDAGMDDHLGKPIDPEQLYARLLRWLPKPVPAPVDWSQVSRVSAALGLLLATDDVRSVQMWNDSRALMQAAYGTQATDLGTLIERFEFDEAFHTLQALTGDTYPARPETQGADALH